MVVGGQRGKDFGSRQTDTGVGAGNKDDPRGHIRAWLALRNDTLFAFVG